MRKLLLLVLLLATSQAYAQTTQYVSDMLEVPLRTGSSLGHRIVSMQPGGTAVEVIRTDKDTGYSLVKTPNGTQGWILTRYLMDEPSARERLAEAQQALEPLTTENADLKARIDTLTAEKTEQESSYEQLSEENRRLSQELTQIRRTAANAVAIDDQNKTLQEQVVALEQALQIAQQENQSLSDRSTRRWFLLGAGVLLLGMILGLIVPRLRWQKRNRWGDL
jgi:SH3 domain protein